MLQTLQSTCLLCFKRLGTDCLVVQIEIISQFSIKCGFEDSFSFVYIQIWQYHSTISRITATMELSITNILQYFVQVCRLLTSHFTRQLNTIDFCALPLILVELQSQFLCILSKANIINDMFCFAFQTSRLNSQRCR